METLAWMELAMDFTALELVEVEWNVIKLNLVSVHHLLKVLFTFSFCYGD